MPCWIQGVMIEDTPTKHRNITFHPYFIMDRADLPSNARRLSEELDANGHADEKNIILQIDIEGAEWEVFAAMDEATLKRFQQIVIEFHELQFDTEKLAIMEKIRATHTPIHIHYNNYKKTLLCVNGFIYHPRCFEISYVRTEDYTFSPCDDYFPTPLDAPNAQNKPDIPIGFFDILVKDFQ